MAATAQHVGFCCVKVSVVGDEAAWLGGHDRAEQHILGSPATPQQQAADSGQQTTGDSATGWTVTCAWTEMEHVRPLQRQLTQLAPNPAPNCCYSCRSGCVVLSAPALVLWQHVLEAKQVLHHTLQRVEAAAACTGVGEATQAQTAAHKLHSSGQCGPCSRVCEPGPRAAFGKLGPHFRLPGQSTTKAQPNTCAGALHAARLALWHARAPAYAWGVLSMLALHQADTRARVCVVSSCAVANQPSATVTHTLCCTRMPYVPGALTAAVHHPHGSMPAWLAARR